MAINLVERLLCRQVFHLGQKVLDSRAEIRSQIFRRKPRRSRIGHGFDRDLVKIATAGPEFRRTT
jgi:hypothetical protein